MELALCLIIFAAMIVVWFTLPGSMMVEERQPMATSDSRPLAPAKT
jgi:uncharacterized membrane protein